MKLALNTPAIVAQLAHVGWGLAGVLFLRQYLPASDAAYTVGILATMKEFIECTFGVWEPVDTIPGSALDLVFWLVGIILGAL